MPNAVPKQQFSRSRGAAFCIGLADLPTKDPRGDGGGDEAGDGSGEQSQLSWPVSFLVICLLSNAFIDNFLCFSLVL